MPVANQIIIIYAATKKYLLDVEVSKIGEFEEGLFNFIDTKYPEIITMINERKALDADIEELLNKAIKEFKA